MTHFHPSNAAMDWLISAEYVWSLAVCPLDPSAEKGIKHFNILITLLRLH